MKFSVDREHLAATLSWVVQVTPKNPTNPALLGVRLTLTGEQLTVQATDYDTAHTAFVSPVMPVGDEEGDVLAPGPMLRDLVNALRGDSVVLETSGDELVVSAGRSTYRTRLLAVEEFPDVVGIDRRQKGAHHVGTVEAEDLRRAAGVVLHLVDEDVNEAVRGLRLEHDPDHGIALVGAQTSAVAVGYVPLVKKGSVELRTQVPGGVFAKAVRGMTGQVKIGQRDGVLELRTSDKVVAFRTYAGDGYVKWRAVLRDESPYVVTAKAPDLVDAARRASIAAVADAPLVLEFSEGEVAIRTGSADVATGLELLDVEAGGERHEARFSPTQLTAALATFTGRVELGMVTERVAGVIIRSLEDEPALHIVMPRRDVSKQ